MSCLMSRWFLPVTVPSNINSDQRNALKHLTTNTELHISVADKTSEFVVMKLEDQIAATTQHFDDSRVYKEGRNAG